MGEENVGNGHAWRMLTEYLCTISNVDTALIAALAEYSNFFEEAEKPARERLALRYLEHAIATDPSFPIRPLLTSNPVSMSCEDVFLSCLELKFDRRYPPVDEMGIGRNFVPAFIAERKRALPPPSFDLIPLPQPENSPIASPNPQNVEQLQVSSPNPQISSSNPQDLEQISSPNPQNLEQAQISNPNPQNLQQAQILSPNPQNLQQVQISSPNPQNLKQISNPNPQILRQAQISSPNPQNLQQAQISSPNPQNLQQAQISSPNPQNLVEQLEISSPNPQNVEQPEIGSVEEQSDVLQRRGKQIAIQGEKQLDKCSGVNLTVGTSKGKEILIVKAAQSEKEKHGENGVQDGNTSRYPKRQRRAANVYLGQEEGSSSAPNKSRSKNLGGRRKLFFSKEEEEKLKEGVRKFGTKWKEILQFGELVFDKTRLPLDLKDKWRNMSRKHIVT